MSHSKDIPLAQLVPLRVPTLDIVLAVSLPRITDRIDNLKEPTSPILGIPAFDYGFLTRPTKLFLLHMRNDMASA
jgi:hypothetical protein